MRRSSILLATREIPGTLLKTFRRRNRMFSAIRYSHIRLVHSARRTGGRQGGRGGRQGGRGGWKEASRLAVALEFALFPRSDGENTAQI